MKSEELLYAIGMIDDDLIKSALLAKEQIKQMHQSWKKRVIVKACLSMGLIISVLNINSSQFFNDKHKVQQTVDHYVKVSDLLIDEKAIYNESLKVQVFPINGRIAAYHQAAVSDRGMRLLPESLGKPLENVTNCYRLLGHEELQYFIVQDGNDYTLWQFDSFLVWDDETFNQVKNDFLNGTSGWLDYSWFSLDMNFTPYNYDIVLKDIYGLTSAEAITSIIVEPANMDNSEAGQVLQKEIGETVIIDKNDIATIYKTISTMICLDDDNWDKIGIGDDTNTLEEVRQGRYLTIKFDKGMQIDNLKYTALSKQFYEYGGVSYNVLDTNIATKIEKILKI